MALYALHNVSPSLPTDGDVWIAENATVLGDVHLGSGASVWFGASLRADHEPIRIGTRSNIQESAVLHVDPGFPVHIGEDTTIGHAAIVHGATIGNGVVIGMGAIVMNGAVIGDGSIVAAGAVVPERKTFPPNSLLVGAPAKLVRTLDAESADRLRAVATRYVENARSMMRGLRRVDPDGKPRIHDDHRNADAGV